MLNKTLAIISEDAYKITIIAIISEKPDISVVGGQS